MATKITRDIIESYLNCKYKGHLQRTGERGTTSDYEAMTTAARASSRELAVARLVGHFGEGDACRGTTVTAVTRKPGALLLADADLEDDALSLRFDALKRADGPSKLGDHHYVPVLHNYGDKVGRRQKGLLAVLGFMLGPVQGLRPATGLVARSPGFRLGKVRLDAKRYREAEQVLDEVKRLQEGGAPPRLTPNGHCRVCEFRQRCHLQAVQEDSLSLLRGMNEKEIRKRARKGIFTRAQLAHAFRPRRQGTKARPRTTKRQHALHAMAIPDRRVYVPGTPAVPDGRVRIYLDVEGNPDESSAYLIGMLVVSGGVGERFSFRADGKDQEPATFERFLTEVVRHESFVVSSYGGYARAFLRRMRQQAGDEAAVDRVPGSLVNTLALVYAHLYFPGHANGLKDLAGFLGCVWSGPDASGLPSLVWRARREATGDEEWRRKLATYNQEECTALRRVTDFLRAVNARTGPEAGKSDPAEGPPVVRVQELKDDFPAGRAWGNVPFAHADFAHVNRCAYFDYQRERVYVRSSPAIRRSQRRYGKSRNRKLRCNRHFDLTSSTCPACQGTSVVSGVPPQEASGPVPRLKRALDLVRTSTGIRRSVVHSHSSVHRCLACGFVFVPDRHRRLDKHFHGLKAWATYQHVAHRLDLHATGTRIEEFFGVRVSGREILMIKSLPARYYGPTYQQMLKAVLAGNLLHIDETGVKAPSGNGYVWVFADLENVVYLYRPNRAGDFLREMLKDFRGVLVSDFYAAHDALDCPRQQCLTHLIRDMNQELLANPFDEELRSVTRPFGTLLRAVVKAVDEHGLRRRDLRKHAREVEAYFVHLSGQVFRSEAAQALQARRLKCRGKLVTFLADDGVPWNNDNAGNAVKRFAYYREVAPGPLHGEGLGHYLVLLSLYQSCRYKGVNFLRFLMSGERDPDFFARRRRTRERLPALQLYPEDFAPPHLTSPANKEACRAAGCAGNTAGGDGAPASQPNDALGQPPSASEGATAG